MNNNNIVQSRHVMAVKNLATSTDYYMNKLGFSRDFSVDGWEFLSLENFRLQLGECPDEIDAGDTNNHSYFANIEVRDIDALYDSFQQAGANISSQPENKSWGLRELLVQSPDGHRMLFIQPIETDQA